MADSIVVNPSYLRPFDFEIYDFKGWDDWLRDFWYLSVYASAIYLLLIYVGQKWMESRKPFDLRGALIWWNVGLCLGSFVMFSRIVPELFHEVKDFGVYHTICNGDGRTLTLSFWSLVFTLSKILEFGDTAFIVLRKQRLIFLHWFHHITVAMFYFYTGGAFDPTIRFSASINSFIHFNMYGYYALKAMRVKIPKNIAMLITSMQILQMLIGVGLGVISFVGKVSGMDCVRPYRNIFLNVLILGSYFILFVKFFKAAYYQKKPNLKNK